MAKLTKEQYERQTENAARRYENNKTITTLTEEQHDIISEVCNMRHEIHSSGKELYNMQSLFSNKATTWLEGINSRLITVNFKKIENIPRAEDFPSAEDKYLGVIEEDEEEENVEKFYSIMNELNNSFEQWLRRIDAEHGTNYCPTGAHRMR
jgi:hypothetical protein